MIRETRHASFFVDFGIATGQETLRGPIVVASVPGIGDCAMLWWIPVRSIEALESARSAFAE